MHGDASYAIPDASCDDEGLLSAARETWNEAVALGELYGYRNAQATVLAPTGTISFLMDCDTTGVEPDFSLVKYKELVGGGTMTIVNRTVPMALRTLGYSGPQIEQIEAHINEHGSIVGAPGLAEEHQPVFDVAVGARAISHMGHIKMMGAVQPFLSGAISKTVNLPQTATVEDIADAYLQAWRLGAQTDAARAAVDHPQVLTRRPRGLHHGRHVRGRHGRGDLPHRHRQGGLDAARHDELVRDRDLDSAQVRGAARDARAQVRLHALRAGGDHHQPGDPVREVDAGLHHALARLAVPRRGYAGGARDPHAGGAGEEDGRGRRGRRRRRRRGPR